MSGLGHAYLRRWARAFGWYAAVTATLVFVVPDAAVDRVAAGDRPPVADIAPALVVVAASVVDAYVLALRNNREYDRHSSSSSDDAADASADRNAERTSDDELEPRGAVPDSTTDTVSCPHCGRDTDATLDFCQWCADPLEE